MPSFKEKLLQHKTLLGTIVTMSAPVVSEILSQCGFDWLFIDMEHSPLNLEQVQMLIQAKQQECSALIRIPANDEIWIKRALDLGVDGLIIPQIKTAKAAKEAIAAAKYPPLGHRSVGIARAHHFGMEFSNYIKKANDHIALVLMIEDKEGVEQIESIVQVPGVDAIMIGPYDLSGSYDKLGQIEDVEVQKGIEKVRVACRKFDKPLGIFALEANQGKIYLAQGYQFLVVGMDVHYLWSKAKEISDTVQSSH